jgi:predicted GIY-YIG superfamily endonuclease
MWLCEHAGYLGDVIIEDDPPSTPSRQIQTTWHLYVLTCHPTGQRYIGQTRRPVAVRFGQHLQDASSQRYDWLIAKAMREHGPDAFSIEHVACCRSRNEANECEVLLIKQYGTLAPDGLNMTLGGHGRKGMKMSDQWRAGQSARMKVISDQPAWRADVSARLKARWATLSPAERSAIVRKGYLTRSRAINQTGQHPLFDLDC